VADATLNTPVCCCFDQQRSLLITDFYNHCVRKLDFKTVGDCLFDWIVLL
jgi:hypothetical protein